MAKLKIKKYGNPILRKRAEVVSEINENIKKLASDMLETMYSAPGVGLAAPQVGISLRLCVIDVDPNKKSPVVMINPEIILCGNKITDEEGCLSFPGFYENVNRFENIIARYTDLNGSRQEIKVQNFLAKAVQHEIDHLDAKLFIDYLPDWKRKSIEKKIKRKKKAGDW
ncbi:peptide deformylase [Candidatus Endomicrobiellum trichonymphae]|uniref:Peptide deformylase n=1 Tax=Endomicrobium trichonymphae TaxID=1408204 RepID=A0A1E5ILE4_ENDTX|nr:peptide deformylase [Candidatus Endomicrobium trichonymphae]